MILNLTVCPLMLITGWFYPFPILLGIVLFFMAYNIYYSYVEDVKEWWAKTRINTTESKKGD